jgi:hypothetical protein
METQLDVEDNLSENARSSINYYTLCDSNLISNTKTFKITMNLRIVKTKQWSDVCDTLTYDRFQQAWICIETGEVEWRDIEVVQES